MRYLTGNVTVSRAYFVNIWLFLKTFLSACVLFCIHSRASFHKSNECSFWGRSVHYGAPEGTRKLKSFEWLDCTNNKVLNVATAQTIKF